MSLKIGLSLLLAAAILTGCSDKRMHTSATAGSSARLTTVAALSPSAGPSTSEEAVSAAVARALPLPPPAPATTSTTEYRLAAGDQLRIIVFDNPDLSGEFEVDHLGNIAFPLVGSVESGGKTLAEVEEAIARSLEDNGFIKDAFVNVSILRYRPFFILGEVRRPGSFPYQSGLNVHKAIALAGGFTYRADEDDVLITRDSTRQQVRARLTDPVFPGDTIVVEERFF